MIRNGSRWDVLGLATAFLLVGSAVTPSLAQPPAAANAPPVTSSEPSSSEGQAVFESRCGSCHDLAFAEKKLRSRAEWQKVLIKMRTYGAPLSDEEAAQVLEYLAKNYSSEN